MYCFYEADIFGLYLALWLHKNNNGTRKSKFKSHQKFHIFELLKYIYGTFQVKQNNKKRPVFCIGTPKLFFKIYMRSNDVILGLPTDIAFFTVLHQQAFLHLKNIYPELELGSYIHSVDSLHLYEKHFKLVEEMLNFDFKSDSIPSFTFNLINKDGSPTDSLLYLYNNFNNKKYKTNNFLFNWLIKNLNDE